VQEVVAKGKGLEAATAIADRVGSLSPRAIEYCKGLIHNARNGIPRRAGLALERERFMDLFDHSDQVEGVNAFLQKRKPEWKND
jgi:enoyl-CoA hydratase/carnithine racemase